MTLRWQDVAGHVAAPDTSGAASMITRGIEGLGSAVQNILLAPEMRRRAELTREADLLKLERGFNQENMAQIDKMDKDVKIARQEKAVEDFGRVRSQLEELAFNSALAGKGLDPVIQSELYQSLSPEARAHADGLLSGVLREGIRTADARREAAIDNARQAESLALQRANATRAAILDGFRIREAQQEEADRKKTARRGVALNDFGQLVARRMVDAAGDLYADKSVAELAKGAGIEDYSMATNIFNTINAARQRANKPVLPEGVLKTLIAGQSGKNEWFGGAWTTFDESQFAADLNIRGDMYDAALTEDRLYKDLLHRADGGEAFTTDLIQQELKRLRPVKQDPKPRQRGTVPLLGDVYGVARK